MRYTTKTDAVQHGIDPALGAYADDFNTDEIFDRAFTWNEAEQAFEQTVTTEEFWQIVQDADTVD